MKIEYEVWLQCGEKYSPQYVYSTYDFKDVLKWFKGHQAEKVVPIPYKIIIKYIEKK